MESWANFQLIKVALVTLLGSAVLFHVGSHQHGGAGVAWMLIGRILAILAGLIIVAWMLLPFIRAFIFF